MQGLTVFQQHVVGDIHHVADGAYAGLIQPSPEREGALGDAHLLQETRRITGAALRGLHPHAEAGDDARLRLPQHDGRKPKVAAEDGREFTGDPDHREAVAAVGGHVDVEDPVLQIEGRAQTHPGLNAVLEFHDAAVIVGEAEFLLREQDTYGLHPPDLGLLHQHARPQVRAYRGEGAHETRAHIGRPADHLEFLTADIHTADREPVGPRMGPYGDDTRREYLLRDTLVNDLFHLDAAHGEGLGHGRGVLGKVDVLPYPLVADLHGLKP